MRTPPTSCRIDVATNERLKTVLTRSKLSRDQFVDFLINEALDQIEAADLALEPMDIVKLVRKELGKSNDAAGLLQRMQATLEMTQQMPRLTSYLNEASPPRKKSGGE